MGKAKLVQRADPLGAKIRGQQVWLFSLKPRLQNDIAFACFAIAFQKQVARLVSAVHPLLLLSPLDRLGQP